MWTQLVIGALVVYATIVLCTNGARWFYREKAVRRRMYFVVVTENAERDIEGVLRELMHTCRGLGRNAQIIVLDVESTDLTIPIVKRFSMQFMPVETISVHSVEAAMAIIQDLTSDEDAETSVYQLGGRTHSMTAHHL